MKEYKIENHISSYLPDGKWELVWSDEFDGDALDETKWGFRLDFWGKRSLTFSKHAYVRGDSCLHLPLVLEDGIYKSAHLQTGSLTFDKPKDSDGIWPFGKFEKPTPCR